MGRGPAVAGVILISALASAALVRAGQQGVGQSPSQFPLSNAIRERGSSVTGAFEGWYRNRDGTINLLVGYFNRNTKQDLDIPVGPQNQIEPGGPDQGQPTHFLAGRQWGVFTVKAPSNFGTKKLTWTLVANGQTNVITMHLKPKAAERRRRRPSARWGSTFFGRRRTIRAATVAAAFNAAGPTPTSRSSSGRAPPHGEPGLSEQRESKARYCRFAVNVPWAWPP